MDTKFWGPSGWKLLHTLTLTYQPSNKVAMAKFLETLPYTLPCKFCRSSLTDYYRAEPFEPALKSRNSLAKWLLNIHNMVNDKLRDQGQYIPANPSVTILKKYEEFIPNTKENPCELFPGWDFLFSIAYNHPLKVNGTPMPDAPKSGLANASDEELNKWNLLPPRKRMKYWCHFWSTLPTVMPTPWRKAWLSAKEIPCLANRRQTVAWLWRVRCKFANGADPYKEVCHKLATYESGCNKSTRAKTCRRQKNSAKTHKNK
jgi:hypothetical protein